MKTPSHHHNQGQPRGGFSLVELLIVMAVLAAVAGLVLPSMRGPLDKSRLTGAAKEIQASLAKARSLAIREGTSVSFRYEIAGARYVIERRPATVNATISVLEDPSGASTTPSGLTTESAEVPAQPINGEEISSSNSTILREGQLPIGVTFAEPVSEKTVPGQDQIGTQSISSDAATTAPLTAGLRRWSDPIRFQPSGRTEDTTIRVAGQRDFVVDVTVRGLTAMASYSAPTRIAPQASAPTDMAEALP
jgi:type II secretion system protein H